MEAEPDAVDIGVDSRTQQVEVVGTGQMAWEEGASGDRDWLEGEDTAHPGDSSHSAHTLDSLDGVDLRAHHRIVAEGIDEFAWDRHRPNPHPNLQPMICVLPWSRAFLSWVSHDSYAQQATSLAALTSRILSHSDLQPLVRERLGQLRGFYTMSAI